METAKISLEELKKKKISFISLGCDKNKVDLEEMMYSLKNFGFIKLFFKISPASAQEKRNRLRLSILGKNAFSVATKTS